MKTFNLWFKSLTTRSNSGVVLVQNHIRHIHVQLGHLACGDLDVGDLAGEGDL